MSINTQRDELNAALSRGRKIDVIHYGCESFFEATDHPAAISAIACTSLLDSAGRSAAQVFSIANSPELESNVAREKDMLERFYSYAASAPDRLWVHWNMSKATYGFSAIGARYRFLFSKEPPFSFPTDRLIDLDEIISNQYGSEYVKHPKMLSLFRLNGRHLMSSLLGAEEAKAFSMGEFGKCEKSVAEKTDHLASTLVEMLSGTLRTANSVGLVEFTGVHLDAVKTVIAVGERFRLVERELGRRHGKRPTIEINDEYDAQDLFRSLLKLFFEDVRPEDYSPTNSGASTRIDFVLPEFGLAVELKYARDSLTTAKLGEELVIDRARYAARGEIKHLVCLVFDHDGKISNPRGVEGDVSREASQQEFAVTVKIFDR